MTIVIEGVNVSFSATIPTQPYGNVGTNVLWTAKIGADDSPEEATRELFDRVRATVREAVEPIARVKITQLQNILRNIPAKERDEIISHLGIVQFMNASGAGLLIHEEQRTPALTPPWEWDEELFIEAMRAATYEEQRAVAERLAFNFVNDIGEERLPQYIDQLAFIVATLHLTPEDIGPIVLLSFMHENEDIIPRSIEGIESAITAIRKDRIADKKSAGFGKKNASGKAPKRPAKHDPDLFEQTITTPDEVGRPETIEDI